MGKKGRHQSNNPIIFKQARRIAIGRIPLTVYEEENNRKPEVFTFNWSDNERTSPLVPRLLRNGECPQFEDALRAYVNCTAQGLPPNKKLEKELDRFSNREQTDAFIEGLRRWHTFSPDKERR